MTRQSINYGTNPNDGTGDTLRDAMDKVNDNFIELYNRISQDININTDQIINSTPNGDITLDVNGTGTVQTTQGLLVNTDFENSNSIFYALDGSNLVTIDVQNKRLGVNKSTPTATVDVVGTLNVTGNVTASTNVTIGTSISDSLTINSKVFGNIIPGINGSIGTSSAPWTDLYTTNIEAVEMSVANVAATRVTATEFTGNLVGNLVTSNDITINNNALSLKINTDTLSVPRQINFPDKSGTVVTKNNGRMAGPYGAAPATLVGNSGDKQGDIAFDNAYLYYCTTAYDGVADIWKKIALSASGITDTLTSLTFEANALSYVDEAGNTTNIDLSSLLDDTNLPQIVTATLDSGTGIVTFIRDDSSAFTADFSALFDDTNSSRISLGVFDASTGELTLLRDDSSAVIVDLDGRYLTYGNQGVPLTSVGTSGDIEGDIAFDSDYMYYCTANYDGSTAVWKKSAISVSGLAYDDLSNKPSGLYNLESPYVGNVIAVDSGIYFEPDGTGSTYKGSIQGVDTGLLYSSTQQHRFQGVAYFLEGIDVANSASIDFGTGEASASITSAKVNNWDTAYSWGDHSSAGYITDYTVTESDVTAHQGALTITESQVSDLGSYLTSVPAQTYESLTGKPATGVVIVPPDTGFSTDVNSPTVLDNTTNSTYVITGNGATVDIYADLGSGAYVGQVITFGDSWQGGAGSRVKISGNIFDPSTLTASQRTLTGLGQTYNFVWDGTIWYYWT